MAYVKDILRPGDYYPPGATRPVTVTEADLASMAQTGNRMLRAGWTVPVCVEHDDGAKPTRRLSRAEARARGHLCYTRRFRVTADHRLQAVMDDPGHDDDRRLIDKLQFVSPEFHANYRTGDGKVWRGPVVTHIALTPTPVNHRQAPFERLSLAAGAVRLSLADYREGDMADENDDREDDLIEEDAAEEPKPDPETEPDAEVPPPADGPPDEGAGADDAAIVAAGEELGIHLPASALADLSALKMALLTAFKTAVMTRDQTPADATPPDDEDEPLPEGHEMNGEAPEGAAPPQGQPGMGGGVGLSLATLPTRERKLAEDKLTTGREKLLGELARCDRYGQITRAIFDEEKANLEAVQLSLNADGDLIETRLAIKLEAWKALPRRHVEPTRVKGQGDGQSRLSRAEPQDPPEGYGKGPPKDEKEAAPVLAAWGKATGSLK